jgi:putative inorganic carbon (HCO3(-)) transporter
MLNIIPFVLVMAYVAFYHFDKLFMILVFCTPLSINIEEFVDGGVGLFLPTEPILFGMLMLIIFNQLQKNRFERAIIFHPISIIIIIQLLWIIFTSITSELPLVSFKFLLTKLWFFIPIYFYGILFFRADDKNISKFIWLFVSALAIVVIYTLIVHASYGFDEKTSHWVMFPFFKDHTSYGAILALAFPLLIGLLNSKKQTPLLKSVLIFLLVLFTAGIIMSYTRAAWLSLFGALVVYLLIRFKVKFKYLAFLGFIGVLFMASNWVEIEHYLERNDAEHATDNMDERIESMGNISSDASNLERINRWTCAIDLWQERPIVGWGPGTYAMVYGTFQQSRNLTIISTASGNKGNAHSEYLGPLAEQGLIGMLLMFVLIGFIMYYGITVYYRMPNGEAKVLLLVSILGLVTYFAHGFLNNYLDTDKATVPVWGLTALIVMLDLKYPKKIS